MQSTDIWSYRTTTAELDRETEREGSHVPTNLVGYSVEALDGSIGKVDETTYEQGRGSIVVDTGPWIFGKKVMLPAGVIGHVDDADQTVYVHRTKDEIKGAPEYEPGRLDESYRSTLGGYYGPQGPGYRPIDD